MHAGREEFRFCRRAIGERPANWFDTQIASGLVGFDFPAAYGTLIQKLLGKSLGKGETRTNWRRRPLTKRQLDYALQDVLLSGTTVSADHGSAGPMERQIWLDEELASVAGSVGDRGVDRALATCVGDLRPVTAPTGDSLRDLEMA